MRPIGWLIWIAASACTAKTPDLGRARQAVVSDGANRGSAVLYFLPPLVEQPKLPGPIGATLKPAVRIDAIDGTGHVLRTVAEFSTAGGAITLRGNHFQLDWQTRDHALVTSQLLRIRVLLDCVELGSADAVAVEGTQRRDAPPGVYALENGSVLSIRFWLKAPNPPAPPPSTSLPPALVSGLPTTGTGAPVLLSTTATLPSGSAIGLAYDVAPATPVSRWAECLSRVLACTKTNTGMLAGCIDLIDVCPTNAGGASCCPPACFTRFHALLSSCAGEEDAIAQSFMLGDCVEGFAAVRTATGSVTP